jgi:hypothetical protein
MFNFSYGVEAILVEITEVLLALETKKLIELKKADCLNLSKPPLAAAEAGRDIWCEKPLTRIIGEGQKVVETAQKHGRIFRINTWFKGISFSAALATGAISPRLSHSTIVAKRKSCLYTFPRWALAYRPK